MGEATAHDNELRRGAGGSGKRPGPGDGGRPLGLAGSAVRLGQAVASAGSSVKLRVLLGSTGMPGAIVVVNVTFFR